MEETAATTAEQQVQESLQNRFVLFQDRTHLFRFTAKPGKHRKNTNVCVTCKTKTVIIRIVTNSLISNLLHKSSQTTWSGASKPKLLTQQRKKFAVLDHKLSAQEVRAVSNTTCELRQDTRAIGVHTKQLLSDVSGLKMPTSRLARERPVLLWRTQLRD